MSRAAGRPVMRNLLKRHTLHAQGAVRFLMVVSIIEYARVSTKWEVEGNLRRCLVASQIAGPLVSSMHSLDPQSEHLRGWQKEVYAQYISGCEINWNQKVIFKTFSILPTFQNEVGPG
uniref:Uncharacterized protein n=1 Tax=Spironucleus salmonicida TaxID=348837 RepID=V6M4E5_9EUKA|eukprot:EST45889.1 Hypothetical protein SS50377_14180 [Spironucleus salmonicida]